MLRMNEGLVSSLADHRFQIKLKFYFRDFEMEKKLCSMTNKGQSIQWYEILTYNVLQGYFICPVFINGFMILDNSNVEWAVT